MKRLLLGCLICACCLTMPAAAVASPQVPKAGTAGVGTDIATGFAIQLSAHGANYLIGKLQDGALGSTGKSIGNFLSDVGLGGPPDNPVKEELRAINERLGEVQREVGVVNTKLDELGATVSNGNYSTLIFFATKLRSAVLTGERKLREIAAAPADQRRSLAAGFAEFYKRELRDKELEFEHYLTGGGVPGAEGILKIASRKARSAAKPFFTYTMSEFAEKVFDDYALVQAVWLEERLNFMHFEHKPVAQMQAAIDETRAAWRSERGELPRPLYRNAVIDTRTSLMWSWRIDPSGCNAKSIELNRLYDRIAALYAMPAKKRPPDWAKQVADVRAERNAAQIVYVRCVEAHGQYAARGIWTLDYFDTTTISPTISDPGGGWGRPTVDQIKALDAGASGAAPAWLHSRGGFPSIITGEVWASNRSGNNAATVNQSDGAVNHREIGQKHFSLLQGPVVDAWYWVQ